MILHPFNHVPTGTRYHNSNQCGQTYKMCSSFIDLILAIQYFFKSILSEEIDQPCIQGFLGCEMIVLQSKKTVVDMLPI